MTDEVAAEMPRYKCHKEVWALKIAAISWDGFGSGDGQITPVEKGYKPIFCPAEYMSKHKPEVGGYYVVYEDGYKSFSPASAFQSGYSRIP